MNYRFKNGQSGFILPVVMCCVLVVAVITGGALSYIMYATRAAGVYITTSQCRLAAQTALEKTKIDIHQSFREYYRAFPSSWNVLSWFDSYSATGIGTAGYTRSLPQDEVINGFRVSITISDVQRAPAGALQQFARVTLNATAAGKTTAGIDVSKTIQEEVDFAMRRSSVFDYAYFVNNYGYFIGNGISANGDVRANGDLKLENSAILNGSAYAAPNSERGAPGKIIGTPGWMNQSQYWREAGGQARPTSPTDGSANYWPMGYEGKSELFPYQEPLEMPYLGDLSGYREVAVNQGGTVSQDGKTIVDGFYSGVGPSGDAKAVDEGCLVLDGTSKPIEISGPVVVDGDVIIKGKVSGRGVIYAGRNIHIVGNITYTDPPSWPKPDKNPTQTAKKNESKDLLGLAAKGNIVIGNYTDSSWGNAVKPLIRPGNTAAYACDPTDASIGYPSTFSGDYTVSDGGKKVKYVYDSKTKTYKPSGTSDRKYYESTVGDQKIKDFMDPSRVSQIDAVLYNNHAVMGRVENVLMNGAMVCRDDGVSFAGTVRLNWDIRLGSHSLEGIDFFIYLPMSVGTPRVVSWMEKI